MFDQRLADQAIYIESVAVRLHRVANGVVRWARPDHGHARAFAHRMLQPGVGEKQDADLSGADHDADQNRNQQRELDDRRAAVFGPEAGQEHHWILTAASTIIGTVPSALAVG
jgi:hypothetical protein